MTNPAPPRHCLSVTIATILVASTIAGCSVNPATGRRQLSFVGEQREIALGQSNDKAIRVQMGLYEDEEMQAWIQQLGESVAARSERPELPWTFRVVDDPAINAFALPGGYIYMTRGILAHFGSRAEVVSVLGHEIGHVTGRHSVEQMSKAQLTNVAFGAAMVLSPELRGLGNMAQQGLGLMFLKFSRDHEREADDLGLRYMVRSGHRPGEMPKVFDTLERAASSKSGQRLPDWLSTHPAPPERAQRMRSKIAALAPGEREGQVGRESFLKRIDGMVYGSNPREGYFRENVFYHPEMKFQMTFPDGWQYANTRQAVGAVSKGKDAKISLSGVAAKSPAAAMSAFFRENRLERGRSWGENSSTFRTAAPTSGQGQRIVGVVSFRKHGDHVFQLVGFTPETQWRRYGDTLRNAVGSFARLNKRRYLDVKPARIKIVQLPRSMTLAQFQKSYPSSIKLEELARINGVDQDARLERGFRAKRVIGGKLP